MIFDWFDIWEIFELSAGKADPGQTIWLGKAPPAALLHKRKPDGWRSLSIQYIACIKISADKEYQARVDAIPFLYEMLVALSSARTKKVVEIVIGEEWWLTSERLSDRTVRVSVGYDAVPNAVTVGCYDTTTDEFVVFLATRIATMIHLLDDIAVDFVPILKQFPTESYKRG